MSQNQMGHTPRPAGRLPLSKRDQMRRSALTVLFLALFALANFVQPVGISLADNGLSSGDAARVANTDGDALRMRDEASASSNTLTMIDANEVVTIKGGPVKDKQGNSFYKISYNGKTGYAMSQYLIGAGKATSGIAKLGVGSPAKINNTDGDGANLRQQASAGSAVLNVVPEGSVVTVMGGPFTDKSNNAFYRVDYKGQAGYVTIAFLNAAPKTATTSGAAGFLKVTNTDGDPIRFRTGPGRDFDSNGFVYEGQVVKELGNAVRDEAGNKWYRVERTADVGYVDASYVIHTDSPAPAPAAPAKAAAPAPASAKTAAPAPAPAPKKAAPSFPVPASNGPLGQRIVNYSMQFLGWRYVWGGHSPDAGGFDCSGLVHWVLTQNGVSAGYSSADDLNIGQPVPLNAIQPGDVLVWVNTYMPGPSHSGIYIGNGRFIHAENAYSGVTIDNMSDPYYASRLYAARRP